ncbi:hypothetical protein RI129_002622 [Pyrocoelia pectoralis]|uniref:Uncharacterized protein n=1 Tax=Pyrocoelia pectoralis TaxID=417401 RepID=A0AAN7VGE0_9COLE
MDNGGFYRNAEEGTELGLVRNPGAMSAPSNGNSALYEPSTSCNTEVCQSTKNKFPQPNLSNNPWNRCKTISLIVMIILFVLWIIIYTVLSQMNLI